MEDPYREHSACADNPENRGAKLMIVVPVAASTLQICFLQDILFSLFNNQ